MIATSKRQALHSSASNEWITPPDIIKRARAVLGAIDLDPCSCAQANEVVKAKCYYSLSEEPAIDGLHPMSDWGGRVWMNPPYGGQVGKWIDKLVDRWRNGVIDSAITLVNATPDRSWFRELWRHAHICFLYDRVRFLRPDLLPGTQPTHPSVIAGFSVNPLLFAEHFGPLGRIVWRGL